MCNFQILFIYLVICYLNYPILRNGILKEMPRGDDKKNMVDLEILKELLQKF